MKITKQIIMQIWSLLFPFKSSQQIIWEGKSWNQRKIEEFAQHHNTIDDRQWR